MQRRIGSSLSTVAFLILAGSGCQAVTDFDLDPVAERSDPLCSDGKDNDFNGLVDCQDWGCLDQLPCCDIPELLIVDDFGGGPADCATAACEDRSCGEPRCGPDPEVWHTWPCPYPTVCGGQLRLHKTECFASGALAREPVRLAPGLRIVTEIVGRPERLGYLEIALTLQDEADLSGAFDECGRNQRVDGFAAVRQLFSDGGFALEAQLQRNVIGAVEVADPDVVHRVEIAVDAERRISFAVDGEVFASSAEPLPPTDELARIALAGLTQTAAFEGIRVQAGLRCHDPAAWEPVAADLESSVALAGDVADSAGFDSDEVYQPAIRRDGDRIELYYTGCQWVSGTDQCDSLLYAVGRAVSVRGGPFVRDPQNPLIRLDDIPSGALSGIRDLLGVDVLDGSPLRGFLHATWNDPVYAFDETFQPVTVVLPTDPEAWDAELCCASVVEGPDGVTRLYYAGRTMLGEGTWHIGLATSTDGEPFVRHPDNPLLAAGRPGSFDEEGVLGPAVVYDEGRELFRLWYEGRDFFGKTAIGYAVSTDGVEWSRSPQNPVLVPEAYGLESIGSPEVALDDDGRLQMWAEGTTSATLNRRIFQLANDGTLIEELAEDEE